MTDLDVASVYAELLAIRQAQESSAERLERMSANVLVVPSGSLPQGRYSAQTPMRSNVDVLTAEFEVWKNRARLTLSIGGVWILARHWYELVDPPRA